MRKPTFLHEYYTKTNVAKAGWLDPTRTYDPYYGWKEYMRKRHKRRHMCASMKRKQ